MLNIIGRFQSSFKQISLEMDKSPTWPGMQSFYTRHLATNERSYFFIFLFISIVDFLIQNEVNA